MAKGQATKGWADGVASPLLFLIVFDLEEDVCGHSPSLESERKEEIEREREGNRERERERARARGDGGVSCTLLFFLLFGRGDGRPPSTLGKEEGEDTLFRGARDRERERDREIVRERERELKHKV